MTTARQDEAGEARMSASPPLLIPRQFHFFWTGSPMPDEFSAYIDGWLRLHPEWIVNVWDDRSLPRLTNKYCYDAAEELAPGHAGQLRSDIARYELLYQFGGVYVDCDFECQRNIEDLLAGVECFVAREDEDWINNAIMGAAPGHLMLAAAIGGLRMQVERHRRRGVRPNVLSGPQYLTGVCKAFKDRVTIFPSEYFYPYLWNELHREGEDFPDAYAIHKWNNKRKRAAHAVSTPD